MTGFRSSAADSRGGGDEGGEKGHLIVVNRGGGAARQEVEVEWKGNIGESRGGESVSHGALPARA